MKRLIESRQPNAQVEIVAVKTSGDKGNREVRGAFVKEIQTALLEGDVDASLHCLKDLPVENVPGLVLAAYMEREDARDAIITREPDWRKLHRGAVVGTGSPRRSAQLDALREGLTFKPLSGNVDTRMQKLRNREYEGIVLAVAGLNRLGWTANWLTQFPDLHLTLLDPKELLPAPGQAVLVLETREDDYEMRGLVGGLDDPATRRCAIAERMFLSLRGGGCLEPTAAHCTVGGDGFRMAGFHANPSFSSRVRAEVEGKDSALLAIELNEKIDALLAAEGATA